MVRMETIVSGCNFEDTACNIHISTAVYSIIRRINCDCTACDSDITSTLPCCTSFIIQTYSLDALSGNIGLVGVAVRTHSAATPRVCRTRGRRTRTSITTALICVDCHITAVHGELLFSLNAVCIRIDIDCTAVDGNKALCGVTVVSGLDAVSGFCCYADAQIGVIPITTVCNQYIRVADTDRVIATDTVIYSVDNDCTIPDFQVILANDTIGVVTINCQSTLTLNLEVILCVNCAVDSDCFIVAVDISISMGCTVRDGIFCALLDGEGCRIANIINVNWSDCIIRKCQTFETQFNCCCRVNGVVCVDSQLTIGRRTADSISRNFTCFCICRKCACNGNISAILNSYVSSICNSVAVCIIELYTVAVEYDGSNDSLTCSRLISCRLCSWFSWFRVSRLFSCSCINDGLFQQSQINNIYSAISIHISIFKSLLVDCLLSCQILLEQNHVCNRYSTVFSGIACECLRCACPNFKSRKRSTHCSHCHYACQCTAETITILHNKFPLFIKIDSEIDSFCAGCGHPACAAHRIPFQAIGFVHAFIIGGKS